MRRSGVAVVVPVLAGVALVAIPGRALAQCKAPQGPNVPAVVHAGEALTLSGAALFACNDTGSVGQPTPTPSPAPKTLNVQLEKKPGFDGPVIGTVTVSGASADQSTGSYQGTVTIPAASTPGHYALDVQDGGRSATFRVLPAVTTTPTLPFTGTSHTAAETATGLAIVMVGVLLCLAGRRPAQN